MSEGLIRKCYRKIPGIGDFPGKNCKDCKGMTRECGGYVDWDFAPTPYEWADITRYSDTTLPA